MSEFKFKLSKREKWLMEAVVGASLATKQFARLSVDDIRSAMLPPESMPKKTTVQMLRYLSMKLIANNITFLRVSSRGPSRDAVYGFATSADLEAAIRLKKEK